MFFAFFLQIFVFCTFAGDGCHPFHQAAASSPTVVLAPFIGLSYDGAMGHDKHTTQYHQLQSLIEQVDGTTKELGGQLPGAFLASIMSGYDPREIDSPLFTITKKISFRDLEGGENFPTKEEWDAISTIILSGGYEKTRVPVEHSQRAAERLMEFMHAKMKAIELSGNLDMVVKVEPLTGEELDRFHERFNRDN